MAKIVIIGAGAMGSAFALPCLDASMSFRFQLSVKWPALAKQGQTRGNESYVFGNICFCKSTFMAYFLATSKKN